MRSPLQAQLVRLTALLRTRRWVAVTGAGCSTESGIPDYRGPSGRHRDLRPVPYEQFLADPAARRDYWARSFCGWTHVAHAEPNAAHRALRQLERTGHLRGLITQNVDGLHTRAGSCRVLELHGTLGEVVCVDCGAVTSRAALQRRLRMLNPEWRAVRGTVLPDGDMTLDALDIARFRVAPCSRCGGPLKPHVVFFGETVPARRAATALAWIEDADALLVIGSSMTVYSGFRLLRAAHRRGVPIVVVNLGASRADELATVRVHARAGDVLAPLAWRLRRSESGYQYDATKKVRPRA